jgi:lipopolysaccharide/colanic/teichoic acid biosynthesis glycosyltransferase
MTKRLFDLLFVIVAFLFFWLFFLLISLMVRVKLGRPIFFSQTRPGLNGNPFNIYKFRSMLNATDNEGNALPDHLRLTAFGRFLRSTSLDELPSLWNIFKGEMSVVGPRPLLMEYLPLYNSEQRKRHLAKPGLTGWAQVNGRNAISWDDKFKYDVWYVEHQNFWLDMKIVLLTIKKVFIREGISAEGEATMSKFTGNLS